MKLRINAKLRAALIAAVSAVGFTLTQAQAVTMYTQPTFGGPEYHWVDGAWQEGDLARQGGKGPVLNFEDVGTVNISGGIPDTSDYGGIRVTGDSTVTTSLGGWAGYIVVGKGASLTASYNNDLKSHNLGENEASVYVEGQLKITGRANLWMTDGNSAQRWLIGEEGFVDLSGVTGVAKSAKGWDMQLNVGAGEPVSLDGYTNRTLGGQLTKKFMSTGADLYGKVDNWAVFCEGEELDSSKYTINHNASGMSVTYDAETAIKKMSLTWAGGEGTWVEKGTHWNSAGVVTSFANGDDVLFEGTGNVASLSGAIVVGSLTVAEGGSTTLNISGDTSLAANTTNVQGATLTLSGSGSVDLGATNFSNGNLVIDGREYSLGGQSHTMKTLTVRNGGVVTTTHDGSDGAVRGDIIIEAGSTFRVASGHDAFGWGDGYGNSTKNIILGGTEGQVALLDIQGDNSSCTLGSAIQMNGYASITQKSGKAAFNANGCSITATGTHNNIDRFQIRKSMTIAVNGADSTLEVGQMTKHNEGDKVLTKNGDGTLIFTNGGAMSKLVQTAGTTRFDNGSTIDALEYTGGSLVFAGGTNTVSGSANVLNNAISVTGGKLILNGSYAIDEIALDEGSTVNYYNTEEQLSNNGFRSEDGSKTIYTVDTEAGAQIDRESAIFTVGGHGVDVGNDGKYLVTGTVDYTVLWANDSTPVDYATYKEYATGKGAASLAVRGTANGTVNMGDNGTIDSLVFDANGVSAGLAGTGTITAISGTGTLILRDGARATIADQTVSNDRGIFSTGSGTLVMTNLAVDNNASRVEFDTATEIGTIEHTGGIITFGGNGITHNVTNLKLSQNGNRDSVVNIAAGTTVHVTGTAVSYDQPNRFAGSFSVSHWGAANEININGTLISEAVISSCDGTATLNVENGGRLELRDGLNRGNYRDNAITINVKDGATLAAGTTHNTDQTKNSDNMVVNLAGGSTFQAYYGAEEATAVINKVLTFGSGTVTMDAGASGKTLQLNSNIAGEGVTIVKKGEGALALNGGANVLYNAIDLQEGTLVLNGTVDASNISHTQGSVQYFKDDKEGTPATENGFAKYTGEVQLINGNCANVSVGEHASITLDGYSVKYNSATGKAEGKDISLDTYFINVGEETLSTIHAVSANAGVTLADGTKLVADEDLAAVNVKSGKGYVEIGQNATVQNTSAAIELSGTGTYALAAGSLNKGGATLGEDWHGYLRITNFQPGNAQNLSGLGSALELNGFKGWDNNWAGTMAMDIRLTDYVEGETTKVAWSCGAFSSSEPMPIGTFTGDWSGTGTFKQDCASGKYMGYEYQGNIADWNGAFITTCETVLTFSNAATDVNIDISKESGKLGVIVNTGATFTKSVTADTLTINAGKSATLKGETTIGSLACAGSLAVDAGEHTVTINGITGLSNTITLTSGTLSLNGTVNISEDMPVTGGNTYYIGGQDTENGFKTIEGKLQVVAIGDDSHFIEGEGISYQYGGKEIATSLTEGAITVEPTTTYGTFFVRKANTTESLEHAIQVATEASAALTAVVMSADTTLAADAEATYDLTLDEGASATVNVTAATTIGTLTGTALTINGDSTLTIGTVASAATLNGSGDLVINGPTVTINGNNKASFTGDVEVKAGTLKLGNSSGDQYVLGAYNYSGDTPRTITIRDGATIDINGHGDGNYVYTLDGGRLTNTGAGKNANNSQTVGLILTKDSFVGGEGSNEFWLRQRSAAAGGDATKLNLGEYNLTKQGNSTFGLYNTAVTGTGSLVVEGGTVNFSGGTIASNVVLNGGALAGTLVLADDITVTAKTDSTMGAGFNVGEHTLTLDTDEGKAITFSSKYTHGAGTLKADGTVKFTSGLTPNAGTVEVAGEVTVSGSSLDLSNGGNSTGKVKVDGTGTLNVNSGMWMAKTAGIDIADGGTVNIAGLQIVGTGEGGSLTTTADNMQYGTGNNAFTIANATVNATGNVTIGNTLSNVEVVTGAHTVTLNSLVSSVTVSENGGLVVNVDMDLAGNLQSSGAITVNAEKTLTLGAGSTVYQTITNNGAVSLTGITLGAGFQEQQEGSAYYDIDGNVTTEDQNHYAGSATTYVQVVDGGTSTGTGIKWNENSYDLSENTGRIIVGQGGADYSTFFVKGGTVELSKLNAGTSNVKVEGGTLVVDNPAAGITIEVTDEGTITGEAVTPEDVKIANWASAEFTKDVQGVGYEFKTGDAQQGELGTVTITNFGEDAAYSAENPLMMVSTQTLEMTDHENDATVTNMVMVNEVVNETGHKLTLENAADLELKSMTIGQGSTVEALYTDAQDAQVEGTVTITESLVAGGGVLLANLVLADSSTLDLQTGEGAMAALTLGSNLAFVDGGLVILDATTLAKLDELVMGTEGNYLELVHAATGTTLTYGEDGTADYYNGMWFGQLFDRPDTLIGDFKVVATGESFGLTKVSNVPEPTTGTLSLLALAALAARRRKH